MKGLVLWVASALVLNGCDAPMKTSKELEADHKAEADYKRESEKLNPAREEIKKYLLSRHEPSIKDVNWSSDYTLKVGRYYKGDRQDGFAEYLCTIVQEHGWGNHKLYIDIIDIVKVVKNKEFDIIGEAKCDFKENNEPPTLVDFTKKQN